MSAITLSFHPDGMLVAHGRDATFICLEQPARCGACGGMHCWFVNRDGATRCCSCDLARHRAPLQPCNSSTLPPAPEAA